MALSTTLGAILDSEIIKKKKAPNAKTMAQISEKDAYLQCEN